MKDGKLDGYFFNGGPPVAAITDLAASQGVKMKLLPTAELVPVLNKKYGPVFAASQIPAKAYPNQEAAVPVIAAYLAPASAIIAVVLIVSVAAITEKLSRLRQRS